MSSFEQKLARMYKKNALVSDIAGYGNGLSGGASDVPYVTANEYKRELERLVSGGCHDMSGGVMGYGKMPGARRGKKPKKVKGGTAGFGLSGGDYGRVGFPAQYPGSMPLPGFFAGPNEIKGSGGRKPPCANPRGRPRIHHKQRHPYQGPRSEKQKAWIDEIRGYVSSHPGVSWKEAMIALKGSR